MLPAIRFLFSKLFSALWRKTDVEENGMAYGGEICEVREGAVTQLFQDYGLIDHSVYFTAGEVLGGVQLHEGDYVHFVAVRDGDHGGWRALRVERKMNAWESGLSSSEQDVNKLQHLIGMITSCNEDGGFINQTTYFPQSALCEGFKPMKGDWVQAEYCVTQTECSSQARTVSPLRYQCMDQVHVKSVLGSIGVVEDNIFFNLNSLLLPAGYKPSEGDAVRVVVVESSQSIYCWRALCMSPIIKQHLNTSVPALPESDIQSLFENKGGVVVSDNAQFGSLMMGESKKILIWIHNTGSESTCLKCCEFAGWDSEQQFTFGSVPPSASSNIPLNYKLQLLDCDDSIVDLKEEVKVTEENDAEKPAIKRDLVILPGEKVSISVDCQAKNMGRCAELLLLHFSSFTIGRRLEVSVSSSEENLLKPSAPYCPALQLPPTLAPQNHAKVVTVMAPAPLIRLSKRHLPNFLRHYPVPQALRKCVRANNDVLVVQPALGESLSPSSMVARFSALLWLEELHVEKELKEFNISGAFLKKGAECLHLEVPGLIERRLSLYIGDKILLRQPCNSRGFTQYIGYITEVSDEVVSFCVNTEFYNRYLGEPLDVEFLYNRLTMRRCHCALEQTKHFGENVLFPQNLQLQSPVWTGEWEPEEFYEQNNSVKKEGKEMTQEKIDTHSTFTMSMTSVATQTKTDLEPIPIPSSGMFFNCSLNPAQKEAVRHILRGECRPSPYVLFGPPGTGKTVTFIEAILQVYYRVPSSRILICTPSNSAADQICIRLHESHFLHADSLARINATYRLIESAPEVLQQYIRAGEDVHQASFYRIVVSTCSSAGMLYQIGLRVGHFTHVFLDEAGQATEPESLIPLGLLSEKTGQIVLAGDPKQLGPVVKSKVAEAFGLRVSLLERLMASPLYSCSPNGYNPLLVTKLQYNYRSHEVLLELPSRLFYSGELCVRSQRAVVDSFCHWSHLPTKGFPLIFHGIRGTEMREGSSPSWFNPGEAVQVMLFCCQLVKRQYKPVPLTDIGIISPYRKQVEKIRVLLHRAGLGNIKVGSVEEFQGQEFLVIILSTVRSDEGRSSNDLQGSLGFLSNPQRFNVAITRAKALLVVIGNPHVLIKDPCFHALLQYTYENGAFVGCDPPALLQKVKKPLTEMEK